MTTVTVTTEPEEVPLEEETPISSTPEVIPETPAEELAVEDEILQQQINEVEQWRTEVNTALTILATGQGEQALNLNRLSEQMAAMAGSLGTLLTLAQPQPPPPPIEEEDAPEVLENPPQEPPPVVPESQPEPPPPPRRTGKAWI